MLLENESMGTDYSSALLNPFSILICVSRSGALFNSLAVLLVILNALRGKVGASMFCLAFASYLSLYPALLFIPTCLLLSDIKPVSKFKIWSSAITAFAFALFAILYGNFLWLGSFNFVSASYSIVILMTELTPNVGLWWYFFTEMFEDFRNFFLGVFQLHLLIYLVPLCIKLRYSCRFDDACHAN